MGIKIRLTAFPCWMLRTLVVVLAIQVTCRASEEQAARARERLVLHQAGAGQNPDDILAGLGSANPKNAKEADDIFAAEAGTGSTDSSGEPEPMEAYRNMLKDGMSHDNVVRMLAEQVMQSLAHMENEEEVRAGSRID